MKTDYLTKSRASRASAFKAAYGNPTFAEFVKRQLSNSDGWGGETWKMQGTCTHARFMEKPETHFRFTGTQDKIRERSRDTNHGWYVDSQQDEVTNGVVFQLTAKDGNERFICGCTDPWNWSKKDESGPVIIEVKANGSPYIYDSKEEAARNADSFAEGYAEVCRENDAKQQAEQQIEDRKEEIKILRTIIEGICQEMRVSPAKARASPTMQASAPLNSP